MTKKLCTYSGCRTIVDHNDDGSSPRCPLHKSKRKTPTKEERQLQYSHHYDEHGKNMYHSYRWKKERNAFAKLNPLCKHCEASGVATPLDVVDHIIEVEDGCDFWDQSNWQGLCNRHHIIKSNKEKARRSRLKDDFGYFKRP